MYTDAFMAERKLNLLPYLQESAEISTMNKKVTTHSDRERAPRPEWGRWKPVPCS